MFIYSFFVCLLADGKSNCIYRMQLARALVHICASGQNPKCRIILRSSGTLIVRVAFNWHSPSEFHKGESRNTLEFNERKILNTGIWTTEWTMFQKLFHDISHCSRFLKFWHISYSPCIIFLYKSISELDFADLPKLYIQIQLKAGCKGKCYNFWLYSCTE